MYEGTEGLNRRLTQNVISLLQRLYLSFTFPVTFSLKKGLGPKHHLFLLSRNAACHVELLCLLWEEKRSNIDIVSLPTDAV